MRCKLCDNKLTLKERKMHVCHKCIEQLPRCLQDSIHTLNAEDAKKLIIKFHPREKFTGRDQHDMWIRFGEVGITTVGVMLEKKHVVLFEDIRNFYFDCLPRKEREGNYCVGEYCFNFELYGFPYQFRTLAFRGITRYEIKREEFFPNFPVELLKLANYIRDGILSTTHDLTGSKLKYEKDEEQRFKNKYKNERKTHTKNENSNQGKESHDNSFQRENLNSALNFFNLEVPYSIQELKKVYRSLIVQCHPDQQNQKTELKAEDVNHYYCILKKFAS